METKHLFLKKQKGFSFGETILATFVLSVGLLTVVKLFQVSIEKSFMIRDAVIASQLSQEGIELVRNARDNDFIEGNDGFSSFSSDRHCYIAVNSTTLSCSSTQSNIASRTNLEYSGGQYVSTTTNSKFKRYLYVEYTSGADAEAQVKSFVIWGTATSLSSLSGGNAANCSIQNQCVYTETVLRNWSS